MRALGTVVVLIGFATAAIAVYLMFGTGSTRVLVCVTSTLTCKEHALSEVHVPYGSGSAVCVNIRNEGDYCAPDYRIYKVKNMYPTFRHHCTQDVGGTLSVQGYQYSCRASDGTVYAFDLFAGQWQLSQ